jgi:hypothetical protein
VFFLFVFGKFVSLPFSKEVSHRGNPPKSPHKDEKKFLEMDKKEMLHNVWT